MLPSVHSPLTVCQDRTLSSLPVQAGQALLRMTALDSSEALGPLLLVTQDQGTLTQQGNHQLNPDSVQTQLETPVPWDLEAHTGPFILELKYRPNPTISWMRPWVRETSPHLPTCLSGGAGYTESPASQPSRELHSDSASLQNPNACALSLPEGSLTWPNLPSCGVGSVFPD